MSKHGLWNKPTLQASVADIQKDMLKLLNVKMKYKHKGLIVIYSNG